MRSIILALFVFCLTPAVAVYSQDPLPPGGQPVGQGRQQPAGQGGQPQRPVGGAAERAFSNGQPAAAPGAAPGAVDQAYQQQVSYMLGRNFAMNLKDNEITVDFQFLMAGISDVFRGAQPKWTDQQLEGTQKRFEQEMRQKAMTRVQQLAAKNQQEAATFLAQNGRQQGVQTTASGLQYRVMQQGNGASPTLGDTVRCNYQGKLLNGTEFDSSYRRGKPAVFAVNRVIPGWTEALQKMHVGDKWQLFIPPKLAYDLEPPQDAPIEPGSMLVFEIELLDIVKK